MTRLAAVDSPADVSRAARQRRWFIAAIAIGLTIWGLTDVRARAKLNPKHPLAHRTDFTCYTEAGAAFFDGRDPYAVTNIRGWGYPYPPLLAILVAPLAPLKTQTQALVWYFLSVLCCYGGYYEARRLVNYFNSLSGEKIFPAWIGWAALVTVTLPVLNCLQRGQVGIVKTYFLLFGLRLILENRSLLRCLLGGVLLALPIAIKVTPILPVGVLLFLLWAGTLFYWHSERQLTRSLATTGGVCFGLLLFFLLIPAAFIGWSANLRHLDTWYSEVATRANDLNDADRTGNTRTIRNQSLSNAVYRLGNWIAFEFAAGPDDREADELERTAGSLPMDASIVDQSLFFVRGGLTLLLLVAAAATAWRRDPLGEVCVFGLATAATLVVAPIGRGHYFMLLLPALLFVPWWLARRNCPRAAVAAAIVPLVLCLAHYLALDFTGRVGLLGIGTTLWYLATIVPLMSFRRPLYGGDLAPDATICAQSRAA